MDDGLEALLIVWVIICVIVGFAMLMRNSEWNSLLEEETELLQQLAGIEGKIASANSAIADFQAARSRSNGQFGASQVKAKSGGPPEEADRDGHNQSERTQEDIGGDEGFAI